jgi:hypothetical protein
MKRWTLLATAICAVTLGASPFAYLKLGSARGGQIVPIRWSAQPIRYFVTNRDVPGVSAPMLGAAVARAFNTWDAAPDVSIASEFAGLVAAEPFVEDGASVIGVRLRPDLTRTLAATTFSLDVVTGAVLESDIFFNSSFSWSSQDGGEASRYDVESIAVHEVGHLLGLSHSALGETALLENGARAIQGKAAVMFPIAYPPGTTLDRRLRPDDVAGITDLYGGDEAQAAVGSIAGRVTLNGSGIFGAHVAAFNLETGDIIGSFSLASSGEFVIGNLPRGMYVVRAEPLDDADLASFFEDPSLVNTAFRPAYADRLASVPAGGAGTRVEIRVNPK